MRNRAYLLVALLGLLTFALAPGIAEAGKGGNLSEIALASGAAARAAAVSGPVISVSPLGHDFGVVNTGSSASAMLTISNTGDADLHITAANSNNPHFSAVVGSPTVPPMGSTSLELTYSPTMGLDESATISILSDASNGTFTVGATGRGNAAPVLDPIGNKSGAAFVNLSFVTTASDPNDQIEDVLSFSSSTLPPGATYNSTTGEFSWTPGPSDAGAHVVTFTVSDGSASDSETITITVTAENAPPVAEAGGPYNGGAGQPITLDGSASSDPDGDALSYSWDFGDGSSPGSGAVVTHTYAIANNYLATLTVTDNGSPNLSASDVASVAVVNTIPASISMKGSRLRVSGGGTQAFGLEINARPPSDIDPASVRMTTTYPGAGSASEIAPDAKSPSIGDVDSDGVEEMVVSFSRAALNSLLGNVPNNTTVTIQMTARTTAATGNIPIVGSKAVRIQNSGGGSGVSAFASPNPFNPQTKIFLTLRKSGPVSIRIYSIDGRLVKTLREEFASAGSHEVHWNGTDNGGRTVPSGVYFVKSAQGLDTSVFKLSLLK